MQTLIFDTYQELSKRAADDLIHFAAAKREPLICTASGDSPSGLYKEIVQRQMDVSHWKFVGLDEWVGMNGDDEGSCRYHLNKQFFEPLQIPQAHICFFDGKAKDDQCAITESFIAKHGGIDVAIVGLGLNGHVGMNEPGTPAHLRSHLAEIDPQTQQVGQKYFSTPRQITHGLTVGIATLMEARHIMLIVSGAKKASIVKEMLTSAISEQLPASLLRQHEGLVIYLDRAAAQMIDE